MYVNKFIWIFMFHTYLTKLKSLFDFFKLKKIILYANNGYENSLFISNEWKEMQNFMYMYIFIYNIELFVFRFLP